MKSQQVNERFGTLLQLVLGQALAAAGYELLQGALRESSGKFTFWKRFSTDIPTLQGLYAYIEFQHLVYVSSEWAPKAASRFTVYLTRSDAEQPHLLSNDPDYARRMLSELVVRDFTVAILPSAQHWWSYHDQTELSAALVEAGHLLVGYGLPWLADELTPPTVWPG